LKRDSNEQEEPMHETVFMNEISNALKQELDKDVLYKRIVVNVRLSSFSHVAAESLREFFGELVKGKSYENASLNVIPLEIGIECGNCKRRTRVGKKIFGCPFCGSANISVQMDKEFFV
jgi:Zn finger protein HypA/HybF involved in hydrogenase expression